MPIQEEFRLRVEQRIKECGSPSHRQVSVDAGMSPPTVGAIVRGEFDASKGGPGVFAMKRLADVLDTSLDYLLVGEDAHQPRDISEFNHRPQSGVSADEIFEAYERGARRFSALEPFWDFMDLYAVPDDNADMPQILRLGKSQLFAMRIKSTSVSKAQQELRAASLRERRAIIDFHLRVKRESVVLDSHFVDHQAVTEPVHVRSLSARLGLLVALEDSTQAIAVRCRPIPV